MSGRGLPGGRLAAPLLAAAVGAAGCAAGDQTALMREMVPEVEASAAEIRLVVRSVAPRMLGIIEVRAGEALRLAGNEDERRLLHHWRNESVPILHSALYERDPLGAFIEAWAFSAQVRDYFGVGPGASIAEAARAQALRASDEMFDVLLDAADRVAHGVDPALRAERIARFGSRIESWAAEHPVEHFQTRQAVSGDIADILASDSAGIFSTMNRLEGTIDDIVGRLDLYTRYLPKQVVWETERMVGDLTGGVPVEGALDDVSRLVDAVDRLSLTVERAPGLVAAERAALLEALRAEREVALAFVQAERAAILDALSREREAVLEALASERGIVLEALGAERRAVTSEVGSLGRDVADRVVVRWIDHVFWRMAQLLAVAGAGGLVAALILLRVARRPAA